ncbi:unnamed protein product, partial [Laminaria digitata]
MNNQMAYVGGKTTYTTAAVVQHKWPICVPGSSSVERLPSVGNISAKKGYMYRPQRGTLPPPIVARPGGVRDDGDVGWLGGVIIIIVMRGRSRMSIIDHRIP